MARIQIYVETEGVLCGERCTQLDLDMEEDGAVCLLFDTSLDEASDGGRWLRCLACRQAEVEVVVLR